MLCRWEERGKGVSHQGYHVCNMQMVEISMFILIFSDCWGKKKLFSPKFLNRWLSTHEHTCNREIVPEITVVR